MSSQLARSRSPLTVDAPTAFYLHPPEKESAVRQNSQCRSLLCMALCLFFAMAGRCGAAQNDDASIDAAAHNIKTVFVIMMENHNWTGDGSYSIKNTELAPYINHTLVPMSSYPSRYFNPPKLHPSLPNYLWLEAGTNFGIHADGPPSRYHQNTRQHLVTLLEKKGISWKAYDEFASGKQCPLTFWHDPMVFFDDVTDTSNPKSAKCIEHVRPFAELRQDLQDDRVARYNFIVPNLCNSMHSACGTKNRITQGDEWLASIVPHILSSSAYRQNGLLLILFDEARAGDGPIPLLVLSPLAKGNGYTNKIYYTHGSTLRTLQEIFGVYPLLRDAAKESDLRNLFITFP